MDEIMTGDVLYRKSNALGPFKIPFSKLVATLTNSLYSHASIVLKEKGSIAYVLEISEGGVTKLPLERWECLCVENMYSVYRMKENVNREIIEAEIHRIFDKNPEYNFTFDDPSKLYCTESVAKVYENAGYLNVFNPKKISEVVPFWKLLIIRPVNWIVKLLTGKGLSFKKPLYFVGNEEQGMISSRKMYKVKDVYINQI